MSHNLCEPLRPVVRPYSSVSTLYFCLSFASRTASERSIHTSLVCDIVWPPPCRSTAGSVVFGLTLSPASNTICWQLASILQTWPKSLSFLWTLVYSTVYFCTALHFDYWILIVIYKVTMWIFMSDFVNRPLSVASFLGNSSLSRSCCFALSEAADLLYRHMHSTLLC